MKKINIIFVLALIALFSIPVHAKENSFKTIPEKPKAGDEVTVIYDAAGTPLSEAKSVYMMAFAYSAGCKKSMSIYDTYGYDMKKEGNLWIYKFKIEPIIDFVGIVFYDDGSTKDNNQATGYLVKLYDEAGKETIKSQLAYAAALVEWGTSFLNRDLSKGYELFTKIFSIHPELKANYMNAYAAAFKAVNKADPSPGLTKILEEWLGQGDLTDEDYSSIAYYYKSINMLDKEKEVKELGIKKYPRGMLAYAAEFPILNSYKSVKMAVEHAKWMAKEYPPVPMYNMPVEVASVKELLDSNMVDDAKAIVDFIKGINRFNYRSAITLTGFFVESGKDLNYALKLAQECESLNQKELVAATPLYPKANFIPERWRVMNLTRDIGFFELTYARLFDKLNRKNESVEKYEQGFNLIQVDIIKEADVNAYIELLAQTGKVENAQPVLEKLIKGGFEPGKFKNAMASAFKKKNINGFDEYWNKLVKEGAAAFTEKQNKQMINKPAPQFALADLEGKTVSLADLKGKVVIVDFWATWCGPCKASFPAMQKAVNKFKDNKDVVFLFVNTWQTELDKKKNAQDFINETKYTFHVLLDNENKVVTDFKVSGIPTKFVVDKNGNIRFSIVGNSGSEELAVAELSNMIELAGK